MTIGRKITWTEAETAWHDYVQSGESLATVARRHGMSGCGMRTAFVRYSLGRRPHGRVPTNTTAPTEPRSIPRADL